MRQLLLHLLDNELPAAISSYAELALSSANFLHSLISSVVDISRMEARSLQLSSEAFNPTHELEEIVKLVSVESKNKGVEMTLTMQPDFPWVRGDLPRFHQICTGVLSNCVRFTSHGYVAIRGRYEALAKPDLESHSGRCMAGRSFKGLSIERMAVAAREETEDSREADTATVTLYFEVDDSGAPVAVEHRELVFQSFVASPEKDSRHGGTGVGLGVVRSLLELMGGGICIVDKNTPGTLFHFQLCLPVATQPGLPNSPHQG